VLEETVTVMSAHKLHFWAKHFRHGFTPTLVGKEVAVQVTGGERAAKLPKDATTVGLQALGLRFESNVKTPSIDVKRLQFPGFSRSPWPDFGAIRSIKPGSIAAQHARLRHGLIASQVAKYPVIENVLDGDVIDPATGLRGGEGKGHGRHVLLSLSVAYADGEIPRKQFEPASQVMELLQPKLTPSREYLQLQRSSPDGSDLLKSVAADEDAQYTEKVTRHIALLDNYVYFFEKSYAREVYALDEVMAETPCESMPAGLPSL
jgi:hypothetical protein